MGVFADYAEILIAGGGIREILEKFQREVEVEVVWKEHRTGETFFPCGGPFAERAAIYPLGELTRLYASVELTVRNRSAGCLVFNAPRSTPPPKEKQENGVAALRLFYSRQMESDRLKSRYRNEFVQDLLYGRIRHEDELRNRAGAFHWDLENGVVCVILSADEAFDLWDLACSRIRAFFPTSIFAEAPDSTVFLLSQTLSNTDMKAFAARLSDLLSTLCRDLGQKTDARVLAAVGGYRKDPLLAGESYQEARQALMILESTAVENAFAFWDRLGGARLIATLADMEPAREFCRQTLGPLLPKHHKNEELIRTLLCLEENGGNLRVAAEKLSLHYNSLKYRAARIWELLGIDPENSDHRFNLSLALRIYRVLKGNL